MPILFYTTRGIYGSFSNFSRHAVTIYGATWRTSEHAFQAQKFHPHRPDLVEAVRNAVTPRDAAAMGRNRAYPLAPGWEQPLEPAALEERIPDYRFLELDDLFRATNHLFARLKDVVMYEVVYAKVTQHPELRELLFGSGSETIVEASPVDAYWGWGPDERGLNKLGRIFTTIRSALRESITAGRPVGKPSCVAV